MSNEEFNIPYYVFEEIVEYVELTSEGNRKSKKWENVKALTNLAVMNGRLTKSQGEFLLKTYNREII